MKNKHWRFWNHYNFWSPLCLRHLNLQQFYSSYAYLEILKNLESFRNIWVQRMIMRTYKVKWWFPFDCVYSYWNYTEKFLDTFQQSLLNIRALWKNGSLSYLQIYIFYWFFKLLFEILLRYYQILVKKGDVRIFIKLPKVMLLRIFWQLKSEYLLIEIYFLINKADQESMKLRAFSGPIGIEVTTFCLLFMIWLLWFV